MASTPSLSAICVDFCTATSSALASLPHLDTLLPPKDGISLLDTKNELFLSYLQALALRNLNVIRSLQDGKSLEETEKLNDAITRKLIEHRVYLEKGVRPLEQKIRFQIDRVVGVAGEEERAVERRRKGAVKGNGVNHRVDGSGNEEEESNSDEEADSDDDEANAALQRPSAAAFSTGHGALQGFSDAQSRTSKDGVYRPPRISATSMPSTTSESRATNDRDPKPARAARSATLDEYVRTELSHAPLAEPSIGSTIISGGRKNKDARQMAKDAERRDYEEMHLMRLPNESKKERQKLARRERGGAFGGEEWRDLGASADRIGDLTKRKGKGGVLEKSRNLKRRAVEDGPRNDGMAEGAAFEARKRRVTKKMKR